MVVEIKFAEIGLQAGPFDLYSDTDGFAVPFATGVTRQQLLNGFQTSAPDYTVEVKVESTGYCTNFMIVELVPTTTTSTTTAEETSTTTSTSSSTSSTTSTTSSSTSTTTSTTTEGLVFADCDTGMDVVFLIDYTGSMGPAIANVQNAVTDITNYIETKSGNNYRLGLVLFDETTSTPLYASSATYTGLPADQKIVIPGTSYFDNSSFNIYITILEKLSNNNKASFISMLNILDSVDFDLGWGMGLDEPMDIALDQAIILEKVGVLNPASAKLVFVITDSYPSNVKDWHGKLSYDKINTIITNFSANDIRTLVMNDLQFSVAYNRKVASGKIYTSMQDYIFLNDANGFPDPSFNMRNAPLPIRATGLVEDSAGRLIYYSKDTNANLGNNLILGRLLTDGDYDTTFDVAGKITSGKVTKVVPLSDGRIILFGTFTAYGGVPKKAPIIINSDGSLDGSFDVATTSNQFVTKGCVTSTNRIILFGNFTTINGTSIEALAAVDLTGTLDLSFDTGLHLTFTDGSTVADLVPYECEVVGTDKIFFAYTGVSWLYRDKRFAFGTGMLNLDGSPDRRYGYGAFTDDILGAEVSKFDDGRFIAPGLDINYFMGNGIYTLTKSGNPAEGVQNLYPTNSSSPCGISFIDTDSQGRYIMSGFARDVITAGFPYRSAVRFLSDGETFDPAYVVNDVGRSNGMVVNSDDSIIITVRNNAPGIYKFLANGSADPAFTGIGLASAAFPIEGMAKQSDGKIIVYGAFDTFSGGGSSRIVRINPDGSTDGTFNIGTGFNNRVWDVAVQSDDKLVCVGFFTDFNGNAVSRICRLNADGSFDNTFNQGTGFNNSTYGVAISPSGKIGVAGSFTDYNGTTVAGVIRLNSDGTLDNAFTVSGTISITNKPSMALDDENSVYVGSGALTNNIIYNSVGYRVLKFGSTGTLDTSFNMSISGNVLMINTKLLPGKVVVGFSNYFLNVSKYTNLKGYPIINPTDMSIDVTFGEALQVNLERRESFPAIVSDTVIDITGDFVLTNYGGDTDQDRKARIDFSGNLVPGTNKNLKPYRTSVMKDLAEQTNGIYSQSFDSGIVEGLLVQICGDTTTTTSTTTVA